MRTIAAVILVVLICSTTTAQERPPTDYRKLVDSLASKNAAPKLQGTAFPATFDWSEQKRTWSVVHQLISHAEEAWPELVSHLDDERYCISIEDTATGGGDSNWTVGDVCRTIVGRNLAEAYYPQLNPQSLKLYMTMRSPQFDKPLKDWCEERSKRRLYELQIESCQWAVKELAASKQENQDRWIKKIKAQADKLANTKTAIRFKGFGPEEIDVYQKPGPDPFAAPPPKAKPASKPKAKD